MYMNHDDTLMQSAIKRIQGGERCTHVALDTGIPRSTLKTRVKLAGEKSNLYKDATFSIAELPDESRSVEEILEMRKTVWKRKKAYDDAHKLVDVAVHLDGPIAIATFGDPHLDDDGTDIELFQKHMDIVASTEGMWAINIGDLTNNWVGRLVAQHANQSTTAAEGWKLAEWVMGYIPWLVLIGGNHDTWSGDRDPLKFITKNLGNPYVNHGVRLRLNFPNGRKMVINASHDFSGHSMWNPVHGGMRKAQRWADDLYVCGHRHHTGIGAVVSPIDNKLSLVIRADSYKVFDDYPKKLGIDETYLSPCPVVIFNPDAQSERDKMLLCLDPDQAASILTHLRAEYKKKQTTKKFVKTKK